MTGANNTNNDQAQGQKIKGLTRGFDLTSMLARQKAERLSPVSYDDVIRESCFFCSSHVNDNNR